MTVQPTLLEDRYKETTGKYQLASMKGDVDGEPTICPKRWSRQIAR